MKFVLGQEIFQVAIAYYVVCSHKRLRKIRVQSINYGGSTCFNYYFVAMFNYSYYCVAATSELGFSSSQFVCAVRTRIQT